MVTTFLILEGLQLRPFENVHCLAVVLATARFIKATLKGCTYSQSASPGF